MSKNSTKISPDDFSRLMAIEEMLVRLSVEARRIADYSGLSRREIARKMGNASPSNLQRILGGEAYHATVETLARLAWACDHELQVALVPRTKSAMPMIDYSDHAHECADVIDLAEFARPYAARRSEWPSMVSNG